MKRTLCLGCHWKLRTRLALRLSRATLAWHLACEVLWSIVRLAGEARKCRHGRLSVVSHFRRRP